ncbi:hypothetical protein HKX48_003575 [Thoreauomyces humboldtii]|nr:hypothetical protein HKX48_003575 [Thoreauomyces humboldtii]
MEHSDGGEDGFGDEPSEVTASQVQSGRVDVQGIEWGKLPISRVRFHGSRQQSYINFQNTALSREVLRGTIFRQRDDGRFYGFQHTSLRAKCSIAHIQLRNLLCATSKNDVFYCDRTGVGHWCPISKKITPALDLHKLDMGGMMVSCMAAARGLLAVGGFRGEYLIKPVTSTNPVSKGTVTLDPRGSTNHVEIAESRSGATQIIVSSNDDRVRIMDPKTGVILKEHVFEAAINCTTQSPDKRLLCAVGDQIDTLILNADDGKQVARLTGHIDYSFACAWSPTDSHLLATGNQDMTTRLYDTRNLSRTLVTLGAKMGAVRSLRFSDDGRFLAIAESVDFVHLVDCCSGPRGEESGSWTSQTIDFFGEVAGVSFTPGATGDGAEALFIGISDPKYGSILELKRERGTPRYQAGFTTSFDELLI